MRRLLHNNMPAAFSVAWRTSHIISTLFGFVYQHIVLSAALAVLCGVPHCRLATQHKRAKRDASAAQRRRRNINDAVVASGAHARALAAGGGDIS